LKAWRQERFRLDEAKGLPLVAAQMNTWPRTQVLSNVLGQWSNSEWKREEEDVFLFVLFVFTRFKKAKVTSFTTGGA
jgi:hypothetical protein